MRSISAARTFKHPDRTSVKVHMEFINMSSNIIAKFDNSAKTGRTEKRK